MPFDVYMPKVNPKFAGPCAQGVLDPLISLVPSVVLVPSFNLDKEHPRDDGPRKCGPWWLPGRVPVVGRGFFFMLPA